MNLFILDEDMHFNVVSHPDKLVLKICLEAAQVLCGALGAWGVQDVPYKPTHANHPICRWARSSPANMLWTARYGLALCREYRYRWGRTHATERVSRWGAIQAARLSLAWNWPRTEFVQAMPEEHKVPGDAVQAYHQYLRREKQHLLTYTGRVHPSWWYYAD